MTSGAVHLRAAVAFGAALLLGACASGQTGAPSGSQPAAAGPSSVAASPQRSSAAGPPSAAKPVAQASTSAAASTQAVTKLVVSHSLQPVFLPVWVTKEAGIFGQHGLDVDLQVIPSNAGMAALVSNQTQVAHVGGGEALSAVVGGADLVDIAGL